MMLLAIVIMGGDVPISFIIITIGIIAVGTVVFITLVTVFNGLLL